MTDFATSSQCAVLISTYYNADSINDPKNYYLNKYPEVIVNTILIAFKLPFPI